MLAVVDQVAAVQPLALQGPADIAAEAVVADTAQPADAEAQTGKADGHVGVGAGDASLEGLDLGELARRLGDEHRHGLAEGEDVGGMRHLAFFFRCGTGENGWEHYHLLAWVDTGAAEREAARLGEIATDAHGMTSVPGIFAAGDVTTVPYK